MALVRRTRPGVAGDGLAQDSRAEDLDRGSAAGVDHALIADLGDQVGTRFHGVIDHGEFLKLVDQRLLTVDMLAGCQCGQHDRGMGVVRSGDDDRVKLVGVLVERLSVVRADEGVGMLHFGVFEVEPVDITKPGDLNPRVGGHLAAVGATDASHHSD